MNRAELQQLATDRIEDARILLDNSRWSAAYYLTGYAVELGLKACVLRFADENGVLFTDKDFQKKVWTHSIEVLVKEADLAPRRGKDIQLNAARRSFWGVVQAWTELSRYKQSTEADAKSLYEAVTNDPDGVFPWIQQHW